MNKEAIIQLITEQDLEEGIFEAKVVNGKLHTCGFYIEHYKRHFKQEDMIQINVQGFTFKVMIIAINQGNTSGIDYVRGIAKW